MSQHPILRAFAALAPGLPLVLSPDGPATRKATVADVEALAGAAGAALARGGIEEGTLVAVAAGNGPGFLAALLALWRRGSPALLLDFHAPEAEGLRAAHTLGAAAVLRAASCWPAGEQDFAVAPAAGPAERPAAALDGVAVVKLTSGSTGLPRGIATPAEALVADDGALAATMGLRESDRLLVSIPLSHSYGLSSLAMPALMRGTPLVVPGGEGPLAPLAAAEREGATVFPTVPAYVEGLLRLSSRPAWPCSLRLVVAAGAPLAPRVAGRFREAFGLPVHVFYGASECGGICYDREGGAGERGTVGTPVDGVEVRLEAPEGGGAPGPGEPAVVAVTSPAVARGYLPDPGPRLGGGRFRAGDLAVWEGGELALRGRVDDLINVKGKKVDPREVERVLAQLAGVEEVAVLGVALPERGSELVRAVIACREERLTPAAVLDWCRRHLAAHKVPRSVILLPELPRTARGKLDRAALKEL